MAEKFLGALPIFARMYPFFLQNLCEASYE